MRLALSYLNESAWGAVARLCARPAVARLLVRMAERRPYTHLRSADGEDIYMERYWLFNPYPWPASASNKQGLWKYLPSIRLHVIHVPDRDRDRHNHPWECRSIVLSGGYIESREGDDFVHLRMPGTSAKIGHDTFHKIEYMLGEVPAITLFITWKYRHSWFFRTEHGDVPWRTYLELDKD